MPAAKMDIIKDSAMIMRTIRVAGQPTARRMPISCVRSSTDMIMVLRTPITPITTAMTPTIQVSARMICSWAMEST